MEINPKKQTGSAPVALWAAGLFFVLLLPVATIHAFGAMLTALFVTLACFAVSLPVAHWMAGFSSRGHLVLILCVCLPSWVGMPAELAVDFTILKAGGFWTGNQTFIRLLYSSLPFAILPFFAGFRRYRLTHAGQLPSMGENVRGVLSEAKLGLLAGGILAFLVSFATLITPAFLEDFSNVAKSFLLAGLVLIVVFPLSPEGKGRGEEIWLFGKINRDSHQHIAGVSGFALIYLPLLLLFLLAFIPALMSAVSVESSSSRRLFVATGNSFAIALLAAIMAVWLAGFCDYGARRYGLFRRSFMDFPFGRIMFFPEVIMSGLLLGVLLWFGRGGGLLPVLLAHGLFCVPFARLPMIFRLYAGQKEASFSGVILGFLLAFIVSFGDGAMAKLLWPSGTTLPLLLSGEIVAGLSPPGLLLAGFMMVGSLLAGVFLLSGRAGD